GRARPDHHVGDRARLLAPDDGPGRRGRVPHVSDDARAQRLREAGPGHVDLRGLVVGVRVAAVAPRGKRDHLPAPFEDGSLVEADPAFDLLCNRGALVAAPKMEHPAAVRPRLRPTSAPDGPRAERSGTTTPRLMPSAPSRSRVAGGAGRRGSSATSMSSGTASGTARSITRAVAGRRPRVSTTVGVSSP